MANPEKQVLLLPAGTRNKSLLCRAVLYSALTYFLILALLFLTGAVFSDKIIRFIRSYYAESAGSGAKFLWIAIAGAILYFTAVAGILLFIFNRKAGFYIFFFASVIIFSLDLSFLIFDWLRYLIHSGYIFILGIAHFSKRCYS